MKFQKLFTALCMLAATAICSKAALADPASYQIKVLTVGSSAQYGVFAESAYSLATADGQPEHYTLKGGTSAFVNDTRTSGTTTIPSEFGNLWIVWSQTTGNVWAYLSVDSTVGVRAFQAVPRAKLGLAATLPAVLSTSPFTNLPVWDDGSSDVAVPAAVQTLLSNATFTAANTDIRPEDALFATRRALTPLNTTNYSGLGYGTSATQLVGTAIQGQVTSGSKATPVSFAISGNDPFTAQAVAPFVTLPIGAAPIVFIANTSDASGLGASTFTNVSTANALKLFSGTECDASVIGGSASVAVNPFLREALSGTMNTTEFTTFRVPFSAATSQEQGVLVGSGAQYNPLNTACSTGSGKRQRAIGTGDEVKGVNNQADGIGYVFFSYEALNSKSSTVGGNAANLKYIQVDGIDPINASYTTGAIPVCGSTTSAIFSCPLTTPSSSFPNLRNGSYTKWSEYRMIADGSTDSVNTANRTNAQALVTKSQTVVDKVLPDFVPFLASCGASASKDEPGLAVYRQHFTITGVATTANDGNRSADVACSGRTLKTRTLGGVNEAGGDVGGTIVFTAAGTDATFPGSLDPAH